jgi:hypothetical protein
MLTYGVVPFNDNARPHTSLRTQALLEYFNWVLYEHFPYSLNLYDRLPAVYLLKNWLESKRFSINEELIEGVKTCVTELIRGGNF